MKVLVDENLDHRLRKRLSGHEVFTVTYKGWAGLKNGELLRSAENDGIEVFLTGGQTLVLEQNLAGLRLAIIAVSAVELPVLKDNLALIGAEILGALTGTFQMVECGRFNQKGSPGMKSKEEKHGQTLTALFTAARAARAHAHAPYSRFKVGAAILTPSGQIYAGCNVENAAYPVGTCAEAGAIAAMVAGGDTRIAAVMIVGDGEALVTPCGACRQRIREFAGPDVPVHIAGSEGLRESFTLSALLPHAFGPDNLAK